MQDLYGLDDIPLSNVGRMYACHWTRGSATNFRLNWVARKMLRLTPSYLSPHTIGNPVSLGYEIRAESSIDFEPASWIASFRCTIPEATGHTKRSHDKDREIRFAVVRHDAKLFGGKGK